MTMVTMERTPRVLAREYKVSWVIMAKMKDLVIYSQHSIFKVKEQTYRSLSWSWLGSESVVWLGLLGLPWVAWLMLTCFYPIVGK